jgi:drug/metabolite transporter (DMT)-like permease
VAVAVLSVSFAAPLFRLADTGAVTASFWRLAIAVLLLLPFTGPAWSTWKTWHTREWLLVSLAGVALAAHFALWVASLFMTTVAASTSLVTLQAVFVALGGHFVLGDRLRARSWGGVALATFGAIVVTAADGSIAADSKRAIAGDLLALLAGIGSAAYFLVGRRIRATRGLVEYVTPVYAVAALTLLLALPLVHQPLSSGLPPRTFLLFVLLAAVPMLGGHTVANWCLKYLPAHTVSTWILLEPVGAALLAWPILDEVPSVWTALGGALVLVGAAMTIPRAQPVASTALRAST